MDADACPFCSILSDRVFHEGRLTRALWDAFPVSPGHSLLIPRRHVATWFDASPDEQAELLTGIQIVREHIERSYSPDGYNIGVNVREAAGQTVFHLHVHVIPRYRGDVADPTGGVRHVIPGKGNYRISAVRPEQLLGELPHHRSLVAGIEDPLLDHLRVELDRAIRADVAVAFVHKSGVNAILEHLRDLLARGGHVRFLTGDYLGVTEPAALFDLCDLQLQTGTRLDLRVYEARDTSFHPKAYLFHRPDGTAIAYVGSSNLTWSALRTGVEWNYRVVSSACGPGFADVADAFNRLFLHSATRPLDYCWIDEYQARRPPPAARVIEVPRERIEPPPEPHPIQREALAALEATREAGNAAGLIVLATGLGKTWLAAFDSHQPQFRRVLFVAHREEILAQAMQTFRRIRTGAQLGMYMGTEKFPQADVVFASIQTLGRQYHLEKFARASFDYVVIDEFHHAAARTYRRLISHFTPKFLLGLTATPERMDGGNLLALCQENLVYRRDVMDGIRAQLLCPFRYFGVPDEVDYQNIPWRNARFDETALTQAVATQSRAENALQQYRERAGLRTLAFCCSKTHADFMTAYFQNAGLRAAAVHSGTTSAPRASSLESLETGKLDVIFAVDMFNEGVDLPQIDTVMMLRPTESSTVWLQQFGRGLRKAEGKNHLTVIDYIGNHRTFLIKTRTLLQPLLGIGPGDREIAAALKRIRAGDVDLPPRCEVTYDLEAVNIIESLIPPPSLPEALRRYYEDFRDRNGERPTAVELFHEGYNPRSVRKGYGSWLGFVKAMGDLADGQQRVLSHAGSFLDAVEITPMTRSFKMLVLQAMLNGDQLPGELPMARLVDEFGRLARRAAVLRSDVGASLDQPARLRKLLEQNPVDAWTGGKGTGGQAYFAFDGERFRSLFQVPDDLRSDFRELASELVEWRLAEYCQRSRVGASGKHFRCRVIHSGGRPILKLPDRQNTPGVPSGWTEVLIDGTTHEVNFVKAFINVIRRHGSNQNVLPDILRRWFGSDAGLPGTKFEVCFDQTESGYRMTPGPSEQTSDDPAV